MNYNNIEISRMTIADFEVIKNTLISEFDDFWSPQMLENELKDINSYYLIAKINNEIVGFAGMKIIIDEADIMNVVTKKNQRNCGIGSTLFKQLILTATEKSIKKMTLEVNEKNSAAIHLYEKFGFIQIAIRKNYYNNTENAVIMQIELN